MAMEGEFKVQLEPKRFAGACTEGIVCDSGCNSLVSAREVQPVKRVFGRQVSLRWVSLSKVHSYMMRINCTGPTRHFG